MRPADPVSMREAIEILGYSDSTVVRDMLAGQPANDGVGYEPRRVPREFVEQLAREVYNHQRHMADPEAYWLTGQRAADALGVSRPRLDELAAADRLPFVLHRDGTRLFRRSQLEVMAGQSASVG